MSPRVTSMIIGPEIAAVVAVRALCACSFGM
jgi:hypothetical protein